MKNVFVFDIDGVLADYEGQLDRVLKEKFGDRANCDRSLYRLEDRYKDEVLKYALYLTENPNFYYPLPVLPGAKSIVDDLGGKFDFWFVTRRPESTFNVTRRWLKKLSGFLSNGDFELRCGIEDKVECLAPFSEEIACVVEDNPDTIKELQEAGFVVLCWSQDWNVGIFPRLYTRIDGVVMVWGDPSNESAPFVNENE